MGPVRATPEPGQAKSRQDRGGSSQGKAQGQAMTRGRCKLTTCGSFGLGGSAPSPDRLRLGSVGGRRDMSKVHFALALSLATGAVAALSAAAPAGSGAAATTPVLATHPLAIPGPGLAEAGAVRRLAQATAAPTTSAGSATPPASAATRSGPTTSGGRRQMSGSSAVERAAGSGNGERYTDCVKLWDSGTHMSKQAWARTCRQIENRLENLQVENLDVDSMGAKVRKKRKSPDAG